MKQPDDIYKCRCKACNKILNCGKSELQKHAQTNKHAECTAAIKTSGTVRSFFTAQMKENDREQIQNFELRLIQIVDHLLPLLKKMVPDSKIIEKATLGRTKCTSLIKNVLAKEEKNKLVLVLRKTKFSFLID